MIYEHIFKIIGRFEIGEITLKDSVAEMDREIHMYVCIKLIKAYYG